MLYDIIYTFFIENVWTSATLRSLDVSALGLNYNEWLSHTCTIGTLLLGVIVLYMVVRWIFRVFAGLIRL